MAALQRAEARMRLFERQCVGLDSDALDEAYGDRVGAFYRALRLLLRTPAPDLPALAAKIALVVDEDVPTLDGGEACMAAVKADALRLARD
jgi:hypothetical protein